MRVAGKEERCEVVHGTVERSIHINSPTVEAHEQEAVALPHRDGMEVAVDGDVVERTVGAGPAEKCAVEPVGPGVIGALQANNLAAAAENGRTSVSARIRHRPHAAIGLADDHNRHTVDHRREVGADGGDLTAEPDVHRPLTEQHPALEGEVRLRGVPRGRAHHRRVTEQTGQVLPGVRDPSEQLELALWRMRRGVLWARRDP